MKQQQLPNILKLSWKDCEKDPPKCDDYYVIKYDNKRYEWFLSYYLRKDNLFLMVGRDYTWAPWSDKPWRWAKLPRIEKERTLFDLQDESDE